MSLDKILIECLKGNKITMDDYTEINNSNIINIRKHINLVNSIQEIKKDFYDKYKDLLKYKDNHIIFKNKILYNRLIKKSNLTYTQDQQNAINDIVRFLTEPDKKIYGLFGYAGTGKTTTLIDFIMNAIELKYINSVIFTAPTNKALNVIKTKISDKIKYLMHINSIEYNTNISFDMNIEKLKKKNITIEFQTIHKLLKFKTEYNIDGEIIFKKDKDNILEYYDIIVIDECSMISLSIIYELLKESKNSKSKIIFSGDPAQLPPVNEKISSIFMTSNNKINKSYFNNILAVANPNANTIYDYNKDYDMFCDVIINMESYTLKEIVRTKHNNIINSCNIIRDWIYKLNEFENIANHVDINVQLYSYDKSQKTKTKWYKTFESLIKTEKDTIIIAWTNEDVRMYNNYLRKTLFSNNNIIREYEVGDILILNELYNLGNINNNYTNKVKFNTSEKIEVVNINKHNYVIQELSIKTEKNLKTFQNHRSIETKYKNFINKLNSIKMEFKCYKMAVKSIEDDMNNYDIYVLENEQIPIHKKLTYEFIEEIKRFRNELYHQYQLMSIDNLIIQPLYNEFYTKFINPFASVTYGYAITCHKAQGSNYKNVFVDFSDIVKNMNEEEMKRCTYTAVSRTIDNLHILV
jgi:ABC-type Na+ transport system ATPase subunit NatA